MGNNTNYRQTDYTYWFSWFSWFKKPREINVGDLGIYHYIWSCDTLHEDSHGLKYDVYAKIKALDIYDELIEIDVVDIKINDSASVEIQNIIKNNFPKYVHPRYVKWQLKKQSQQ